LAKIIDVIFNNAVVLGIKAGDNGVMIREGLGRKGRYHPLVAHAGVGELIQHFWFISIQIIPAKAIERDKYDGRFEIIYRFLRYGRQARGTYQEKYQHGHKISLHLIKIVHKWGINQNILDRLETRN